MRRHFDGSLGHKDELPIKELALSALRQYGPMTATQVAQRIDALTSSVSSILKKDAQV